MYKVISSLLTFLISSVKLNEFIRDAPAALRHTYIYIKLNVSLISRYFYVCNIHWRYISLKCPIQSRQSLKKLRIYDPLSKYLYLRINRTIFILDPSMLKYFVLGIERYEENEQ